MLLLYHCSCVRGLVGENLLPIYFNCCRHNFRCNFFCGHAGRNHTLCCWRQWRQQHARLHNHQRCHWCECRWILFLPIPFHNSAAFHFLVPVWICLFNVADILRACMTSSLWTRQCPCSSSKLCVGIWYQVVLRHMMTTSPNHTIYVAK